MVDNIKHIHEVLKIDCLFSNCSTSCTYVIRCVVNHYIHILHCEYLPQKEENLTYYNTFLLLLQILPSILKMLATVCYLQAPPVRIVLHKTV